MGLRQPWLSGMSSEIKQRRQYIIAEYVTASGALMFPASGKLDFRYGKYQMLP